MRFAQLPGNIFSIIKLNLECFQFPLGYLCGKIFSMKLWLVEIPSTDSSQPSD